uniref:Tetratricopeptide repeat protein 30 n=1 Tax=Panagrellus redivivus TaxID=6233 RepID=A0A7E4VA12_PANRE
MAFVPIKDGEFTTTIYGFIKENRYADCIRVLQYELQRTPNSRAALSLLAYCHYSTQDYPMAAECYDKLSQLVPDHEEYRLYHAQALYNAFLLPEAVAVLSTVTNSSLQSAVIKLDSAIKYREEDHVNARVLVDQYSPDDPDVDVNLACLEYKEGNYRQALDKFNASAKSHGYVADEYYAIALCHYNLGAYDSALKYIGEIVDRGIKDYPELSVGMVTEGMDVRSVGNSLLLHETALVEACNLKFAIDYRQENMDAARDALTDMPPRAEDELDAVTLHNQALINVDHSLADSFAKLQYLLSQNPFPPETFSNLLLLYCKYEYYDLAADVLAENAHLTYTYLSQHTYDYLDAIITQQSSLDEAYAKFDAIGNIMLHELRRICEKVERAKQDREDEAVMAALDEKALMMEKFIPVATAQAKIEWERNNYEALEKLWHRWNDVCHDNNVYKLNLAHTLFMLGKYEAASHLYTSLLMVDGRFIEDNLLEKQSILLANLCASWVLTSKNDMAEMIIRNVKALENSSAEKKQFHGCIIHLVIGTLYCTKGNIEFGLLTIISAMQDCERVLGVDTWYYTKRVILSTLESLSKHIIHLRDSVINELLEALQKCELHGKEIPSTAEGPLIGGGPIQDVRKTVAYEARLLRALVYRIVGY